MQKGTGMMRRRRYFHLHMPQQELYFRRYTPLRHYGSSIQSIFIQMMSGSKVELQQFHECGVSSDITLRWLSGQLVWF